MQVTLEPTFQISKRPAEILPVVWDLKSTLRNYRVAGRRYSNGDYVRAQSVAGFAYQASGTGEAGTREPRWPTTLAGTVVDGSITWTAVAAGTNAIDSIVSAAWSVTAGDVTVAGSTPTIEEAPATFSGGSIGTPSVVQCLVTTAAGNKYIAEWDVTVTP